MLRPSSCPGSRNRHHCCPRALGSPPSSPRAAPPDSDGVGTIPTRSFHSKWESCSSHHSSHNSPNSPRPSIPHLVTDYRLHHQVIFLPVGSYFHNMNVIEYTLSNYPQEEKHPIPPFSLAFSSNSHRKRKTSCE